MKSNEIREQFIDFFRGKGHRFVPGVPLVPADDPTLLFINAGMNQFKDVFLGTGKRDYRRAVNSQKCMRVSGKHNDIEDVGRDTYHHTFFEMLGNWSFGDYYKREAIEWAWELVTKVWKIDPARLWATVFTDDDESAGLWPRVTGIPPERVLRFDEKENFWEMADTGPCGPCSEIHIDMGERHCSMKGEPGHRCAINGGCGRYIELWNLVFIQYNRDSGGVLTELPRKHVDTGLGFERLVAVLEGADSNYATDLFMPVIGAIEECAGRRFDPRGRNATAFRAIADHARALTFAVADGAMPSNEGRGYVLRMILRRAVRYGRLLGMEDPFLYRLVPVVAGIMESPYPELRRHREHVGRVILSEEERFHNTLTYGLDMLSEIMQRMKGEGRKTITGADVFRLYDTYGFPLDLTRLVARENGLAIDERGFEEHMAEQRERARGSMRTAAGKEVSPVYAGLREKSGPGRFCGHEETAREAGVTGLVKGDREMEILGEGEEGDVVLDVTPFYAESGGQVGDRGRLCGDTVTAEVTDTISPVPELIIHRVRILKGELRRGAKVTAEVDSGKRTATARNHTATHLLQNALRQVLGEHVKQAGSLVAPDRLRFDFTHFTAMSEREISRVEEIVNRRIRENSPVGAGEMDYAEAMKGDVIAIFGEKYGDRVRVVDIGGYSRELCGGTHVSSAGEIGLFKILGESSVAAGVRRIEAVSGEAAFRLFQARERQVRELAAMLRTGPDGIVEKVEDLRREKKRLEKEARRAGGERGAGDVSVLIGKAKSVAGIRIVVSELTGVDAGAIRGAGDRIRKELSSGVIVLGARGGEKAILLCMVTPDLVKRGVDAAAVVRRIAPLIGGKGGGRPHLAQAGGGRPEKLRDALNEAPSIIEKIVSGIS